MIKKIISFMATFLLIINFSFASSNNITIKTPKIIFMDWDGTIANNHKYLNKAGVEAFVAMGGDAKKIQTQGKSIMLQVSDYLNKEDFEKFAAIRFKIYKNIIMGKKTYPFQKNILQFIQKAKESNISIVIVSGKRIAQLKIEAEELSGIGSYVGGIFGGGSFQNYKKPSKELAEFINKKHNPNKLPCWFFGNRLKDVIMAEYMGCEAIIIHNKLSNKLNKTELDQIRKRATIIKDYSSISKALKWQNHSINQ